MNKDTNLPSDEKILMHSHFSEILDFLPDATFIINKVGKVLAWNKAMEELTGIEAEQILGKDNYEYALPFYGERRPILIDLAVKSHEELEKKYLSFKRNHNTLTSEVFVPHLKPGGSYLWAKAKPLYDINNNLVGAIETIRDVTDKRLAEEKIKYSEKKLKERVKELDCLYSIIKIISNPNASKDEIFNGILELIPSACENSTSICARIVYEGKEFKTKNYIETPWKISNISKINGKNLTIDIYSLEEKSFPKEELELLEEVNTQLKCIFESKLIWLF